MGRFRQRLSAEQLIARHKNPLGIFGRIPVWALLFWSLWALELVVTALALVLELGLWLLIPPIRITLPFIEEIIQTELAWWRAPLEGRKSVSVGLLMAAIGLAAAGLWMHRWPVVAGGLLGLITFNLLMKLIARKGLNK
ncbi:MAG: hypothetical protein KDC54_07795 [Lewinella sp.]|nr:hypothetical protein [Lewinella sp.]